MVKEEGNHPGRKGGGKGQQLGSYLQGVRSGALDCQVLTVGGFGGKGGTSLKRDGD